MNNINTEEIYKSIFGNAKISSEDIMEFSNTIQLLTIWSIDNPEAIIDYNSIELINDNTILQFKFIKNDNGSISTYKALLYILTDIRHSICDKSSIGTIEYVNCDLIPNAKLEFKITYDLIDQQCMYYIIHSDEVLNNRK